MTIHERDELVAQIHQVGLDDFDMDDARDLVDVLLEAFTPAQVMSWLCFHDVGLDGVPLALVERGRHRDVLRYARGMVATAS